MEGDSPKGGEVLPPDKANSEKESGDSVNIYAQIAETISNYTNRPDLLLDAIEKHDPGFIKRLTNSAQEYSEKLRNDRFYFGKWQAYVSLVIQSIAALVVLGAIVYSIYIGAASFWLVVALGLIYVVSQSGTSGFSRLTRAISTFIERHRSNGDQK